MDMTNDYMSHSVNSESYIGTTAEAAEAAEVYSLDQDMSPLQTGGKRKVKKLIKLKRSKKLKLKKVDHVVHVEMVIVEFTKQITK